MVRPSRLASPPHSLTRTAACRWWTCLIHRTLRRGTAPRRSWSSRGRCWRPRRACSTKVCISRLAVAAPVTVTDRVQTGIHPQVVANAFSLAVGKAESILTDMAIPINLDDRESLLKNAVTSLNSKVRPAGSSPALLRSSIVAPPGGFPKLAPARPYRRGRRAQGDRPSDGHERGPARYSGEPLPPRSRHGLLIPAALLRLSRRSGGRWMTRS